MSYGVDLPADMQGYAPIGKVVEYTFSITNTGNITDTYDLTLSSTWDADLSVGDLVQLAPGESIQVTLSVEVPIDAHGDDQGITIVTAASLRDPYITDEITITTTVLYRTLMPVAMKN